MVTVPPQLRQPEREQSWTPIDIERAFVRRIQRTVDLNEWRVGRKSSLARLQPTFDPASGAVPSFPSRFPVLALDRALGHPHDLVTSVEVHDTPLARIASDHLPIKAHIDLKIVWERSLGLTDRASQAM